MKKFRLLLLDANIVIEISKRGLWTQFLAQCEVYLAATVVAEASFYLDEHGNRHEIELQPSIQAQLIKEISLTASDLDAFRKEFDSVYLDKLDPGETESLAFLLKQSDECRICSADKIVYRVLGNKNLGEQGISLEEVLGAIGLGRQLAHEFRREYREKWTQKGFEESLNGLGSGSKII